MKTLSLLSLVLPSQPSSHRLWSIIWCFDWYICLRRRCLDQHRYGLWSGRLRRRQ